MASNQFSFGIGAGGVSNGGGTPNVSGPQSGRFQPMGFQLGQQQGPLQPVSPNVSGATGFQQIVVHGGDLTALGTEADLDGHEQ